MGFVGAMTELDSRYVRPHDIELRQTPGEGSREAMIERIVWLGFGCRLELVLDGGQRLTVQATRSQVDQLDLRTAEIVHVRALRSYRFDPPA
jgi:hypothetical protein